MGSILEVIAKPKPVPELQGLEISHAFQVELQDEYQNIANKTPLSITKFIDYGLEEYQRLSSQIYVRYFQVEIYHRLQTRSSARLFTLYT